MSTEAGVIVEVGVSDEERNALVEEYLPLVRHVIGRLPIRPPSFMDMEDLFEVGVLGLLNAATTYNPCKGAQFKTHAYVLIRGAILDEIRRYDVLPRSRRDRIKAFHRCVEGLEETLSRPPTPEEIAEGMGLSVEQVEDVLVNIHAAATLSLSDNDRDGGGLALSDCIEAMQSPRPDREASRNELKQELQEAIALLPEQERRVIVLYYAEDLLLKEIGEVLGVSESRISQIHSRAIFSLNQTLRTESVR